MTKPKEENIRCVQYSYVDIQVVTKAFKQYAARPDKNIPVLSEYAKTLKGRLLIAQAKMQCYQGIVRYEKEKAHQ